MEDSNLFHKESFNREVGANLKTNKMSFYYGRVVSVDDITDSMLIKALVPEFDGTKSINDESLNAFPLLPKVLPIYPKVGEGVLVWLMNEKSPNEKRFYMGPVTSQFQYIKEDAFEKGLSPIDKIYSLDKGVNTNKEAQGLYPVDSEAKRDTGLLGRDNADIQFRRNKTVLRAGKHLTDKPLLRNNKNPSYLQLGLFEDDSLSYSMYSADKVILYSNEGKKLKKNVYPDKADIENIIEKGSTMLRGEETIKLMKLIITFMFNHIHPYNNKEPLTNNVEIANKLLNFDFNSLLNKGVITN